MMLMLGGVSPATVIGAGLMLLALTFLVILRGDDADKRMRERLASVRANKPASPGTSPTSFVDEPEKKRPALRAAEMLGYRPDLPKPYGTSLKTVLPVAAILGGLVFKLFQFVVSFIPAVAIGIAVALAATMFVFKRKNNAYRVALFRQIPDTLSLMLRAVRAGLPVAEAIKSISRESMSPTRDEFQRVAAETALGMPIELTLQRLYDRTGIQEYAFFSVVIGLSGQTGGNLSETLENLAETVRRRVAMAGKAKALAAEGRLSAVVVGGLPFVVGVLISITNPGYMSEFIENPDGRMLVVAFVTLLTMGLSATHWLVQRSSQD